MILRTLLAGAYAILWMSGRCRLCSAQPDDIVIVDDDAELTQQTNPRPLEPGQSSSSRDMPDDDAWRAFRRTIHKTVRGRAFITEKWGELVAAGPRLLNFVLAQSVYEVFTHEQSAYQVLNLVFGVVVFNETVLPTFSQHPYRLAQAWIKPGYTGRVPTSGAVQWPAQLSTSTCLLPQYPAQVKRNARGFPCPEGGSVATVGVTWWHGFGSKTCVVFFAPKADLGARQALRLDKDHALTQQITQDIDRCIPDSELVRYTTPIDTTGRALCVADTAKTSLIGRSRSVVVAARKAFLGGQSALEADNGLCGFFIPFGDVYMTSRTIALRESNYLDVMGYLELTIIVSVYFR